MYLNLLLEGSLNACMYRDFRRSDKGALTVAQSVGRCQKAVKQSYLTGETHTAPAHALQLQTFQVSYCLLSTTNQSPSYGTFPTT